MINTVKSTFLMTLLMVLLGGIGYMMGGPNTAMFFLVLSLVFNFFSYWYSDRIVLGMYRAQEVSPSEVPALYASVQRLAERAGLPPPRVFVIPSDQPNAFATGRNPSHAVVAVTQGLMRMMSQSEVEGVLAHELSHIKNRDILTGTIVASVVGAIGIFSMIARWGAIFGGFGGRGRDGGNVIVLLVTAILAPIMAAVIQMMISRTREYEADAGSARINGSPYPLIHALEKLEMAHENIQHVMVRSQASPATAHMFIVNPLRGGGLSKLFRTHPTTQDRIRRLRAMAT